MKILKQIIWAIVGLLGGAAYTWAGVVSGFILLSGAGHSRPGDTAFFLFYFHKPPFVEWIRGSFYVWPLIGLLLPFTRNIYPRCLVGLLLVAHYVSIILFCSEPFAIISYFFMSLVAAVWTALYFSGQGIILYCLFRKPPTKIEPTGS